MKPSIKNLKNKIEKFKNQSIKKSESTKIDKTSMMSLNISSEIVAAILVGLLLGGFLDYLFKTKPIFTFVCLILGCIACFRVIYKLIIRK